MKSGFPLRHYSAVAIFSLGILLPVVAQPDAMAMGGRMPRRPGGDGDTRQQPGRDADAPVHPSTRPMPNAQKRFAADQVHFHPQIVQPMVDLGLGLAEMHILWGAVEPTAPVSGRASYRGLDALNAEQQQFLRNFKATDLELSLVLEAFGNKWAFEFSDKITVKSPVSGGDVPGFVRLKPEHRKDWQNFITHLMTTLPNVKYIQIDNEPENVWVSGEGYVEAVRLAYEAVQAYNSRHGKDVKVMAAGFALGPDVVTVPETVLQHVHRNHPNVDIEWIRKQVKLPQNVPDRQVFHTSQKFHVILSLLLEKNPPFDILTIHNDWARSYDDAARVIHWYQNVMRRAGYQRPLWIDDMHAAYYPKVRPRGTPEDVRIYKALEKGDAGALRRYSEAQSGWLVRKSAWNFAAGAERLKFAPLVDMPFYFMPEWRYAGLFTEKFEPKPAYYTAKLLMEKIDYFKSVTRISGNIYRFTFDHKGDVFIAWHENGKTEIDASRKIGEGQVRITYLITQLDRSGGPVVRPSILVPTSAIPLTDEPVFIERVR
jgi:hypothetical protein